MHCRILRTIDANINRVSEGLRVLEDLSRFIIEDAKSCSQLKSVRHLLNNLAADMGSSLLENRDALGDIGAGSDLTRDHKDLISIARANSKRVQEGLRVLEELAKLPQVRQVLPADKLKEARYLVYSIEKAIVAQLAKNTSAGGADDESK